MVIYTPISKLPFWGYGSHIVDGVRFYFTGANSDPWLICGKYAINYYVVEDYFYEEFRERTNGNGSDNLLGLWLSHNAEEVREFIEEHATHKICKVA